MWKKVVGGIVVLIVAIVAFVFYATSGMTESAESFFEQIRNKHYDQAYAMLSEDFRRSTTEKQMIAFLKQFGIDNYQSASWGNRSFEGKRGTLEGSITTGSGGTIPLTIDFVKAEKGDWQIYSITKPEAGAQIEKEGKKDTGAAKEPEKSAQVAQPLVKPVKNDQNGDKTYVDLVKDTLHRFAMSIKQKNMESFRQSVSKVLQQSASTEQFNSAFKSYLEQGINLTVLDPMQPIFDEKPQIENGILTIKGHYDTTPSRFYFSLSYIQENGGWKLSNINVDIR